MGRLDGNVAVVTAAAQGIGKAIADRFVAEGAVVYASDIQVDLLTNPGFAGADKLDVTDSAAVADYAAKIGQIDTLCNIAGVVHHGSVLVATEEDWDFAFDLNVKSMHRMIKAFLPGMLGKRKAVDAPGGSILNMSSGASSIKGVPDRYIYGATKAAVIGMTKAIAADFAPDGLRCNALCPGTVESPSWRDRVSALGEELGGYDKAHAAFVARQPMGRVARTEEIAALAVYLASDEAAFVTGTEIKIDGGWTL